MPRSNRTAISGAGCRPLSCRTAAPQGRSRTTHGEPLAAVCRGHPQSCRLTSAAAQRFSRHRLHHRRCSHGRFRWPGALRCSLALDSRWELRPRSSHVPRKLHLRMGNSMRMRCHSTCPAWYPEFGVRGAAGEAVLAGREHASAAAAPGAAAGGRERGVDGAADFAGTLSPLCALRILR